MYGWPPVWLDLDSAALLMLNWQQIYLFRWIQTCQTGVQLYSNTSPYKQSKRVFFGQLNVVIEGPATFFWPDSQARIKAVKQV